MKCPDRLPEQGVKFYVMYLGSTLGMTVNSLALNYRKSKEVVAFYSPVPGHGGDVCWFTHGDKSIAPYTWDEVEPHGESGLQCGICDSIVPDAEECIAQVIGPGKNLSIRVTKSTMICLDCKDALIDAYRRGMLRHLIYPMRDEARPNARMAD